jgi:hypothetical protein
MNPWKTCLAFLMTSTLAGLAPAKAPAPDDKTTSHLALIPADSPGFITADFTGFWNEDIVKEFLKKAEATPEQADILKVLEKFVGIDAKDVARITIIMPPTLDHDDVPVVVISTVKPLDKDKVQKTFTGGGEEKKSASGKAYIQGKQRAILYFADARTAILAEGKSGVAYLDKKLEGEWNRVPKVAELIAENKLVAVMELSDYGKKLKEEMPGLKDADALFDAKPSVLTLKAAKDLTLTLNLTYKDEDQAKSGVKAARIALDQLVEKIVEGEKELAKQQERPEIQKNELAKWGLKETSSLLKEFEDNIKKAEVAQKGKEVNVVVHSKVSAARVLTMYLGLFIVRTQPSPPDKEPPPPKRR